MWISRYVYEELRSSRIDAENRASELASLRSIFEARARDHARELADVIGAGERKIAALESIIADLRTQVAVKNTAFDWLSTSHERIERWFAELMASKLEVRIATSSIERVSGMPGPGTERPAGEGVPVTGDGPSSLEDLYRQQSGALFDDMGDALATREGIKTTVYDGVQPVVSQG
jgi:hypothetical protein